MDTETSTTCRHTEAANSASALKEPIASATDMEKGGRFPERDDQIADEQHEKTSCPDVADPTESLGQVSDGTGSENASMPTPFPDGRIFMQGEPPYGYLPTCGPKDVVMPFIPVEPD